MIYSLISRASNMLGMQAATLIESVLQDLKTNSVSSVADLALATSAAFTQFYLNYGTPLTPELLFTGIPIVDSYNDFQQILVADLQILYTQMQTIQQETTSNLIFETLQNELLVSGVTSFQAEVSSATPTRPTISGLQSWILTDSFADTSKIDLGSSYNVNLIPGVVELAYSATQNFNDQASIVIDDLFINPGTTGNSNGFAGNTHEIAVTQNTNPLTNEISSTAVQAAVNGSSTSIVFVGDGDLHANVESLLDLNSTSWFEYEVCNVPEYFKVTPSQYYGFTYGIQLPGLKTVQQLPWTEFHESSSATVPVNLPIFPPLPSTSQLLPTDTGSDNSGNYVNAAGTVSNPMTGISTGASSIANTVTLTQVTAQKQGDTLYLSLIINFSTPQNLTQITITPHILGNLSPTIQSVTIQGQDANTVIQAYNIPNNPSNPQVFVFPQTTVASVTVLVSQSQSYSTSIGHLVWIQSNGSPDAQVYNAAFGNVSLTTVPSGNYTRVDGPNPSYKSILGTATTVSETIDTTPSSAISGPYVEIFPGWRYAIGLRSISLDSMEYVGTGVLVTKNFPVPITIQTAALQVNEILPPGISDLNYELSFDGGTTWFPIAPSNSISTSNVPTSYILNSPTVGATGTPITTNSIPNAVRMRVTLTGTPDPTQTPRLCSYKILLSGNT